MKSCSSCGLWKSDSEFYPDRRANRSKDGRHHACMDCERDAARNRMRRIYRDRLARPVEHQP